MSGFNETNFESILESKNGLNFGILVVLYFTGYLIMDVFIGRTEYPEYMKVLSGNFHHIVYSCVNIASLYFGVYPFYLLHMLSEIPTFILSLGSFDSKFRNDQLFGITFLCTRIIYHIILTYIFRKHSILFYVSLAALGLHIYWFSNWLKKYGFSTLWKGNSSLTQNNVKRKVKNKKKSI